MAEARTHIDDHYRVRFWYETEAGEIVCTDTEKLGRRDASETLARLRAPSSGTLFAVIWDTLGRPPSTALNGMERRLVTFPASKKAPVLGRPDDTVDWQEVTLTGALPW